MKTYLLWYNSNNEGVTLDITDLIDDLMKVRYLPREVIEEFIKEEFKADEIFYMNNIGCFDELNKQFKNVKEIVNVGDDVAQKFINSKLEE